MAGVILKEESRGARWEARHNSILNTVPHSKAEIAVFGDSLMQHFCDRRKKLDLWEAEMKKETIFFLHPAGETTYVIMVHNLWLSPPFCEDHFSQYWDK